MKVKSIGQMIEALATLRDTKDLNDWEKTFVKSVLEQCIAAKKSTSELSGKQVEKIELLYQAHFGEGDGPDASRLLQSGLFGEEPDA